MIYIEIMWGHLSLRPLLFCPVYLSIGTTIEQRTTAYRELFRGHLDTYLLHQIRLNTNQGMALGNDKFKQEVARLSGRHVTPLKRGPKQKQKGEKEFLL